MEGLPASIVLAQMLTRAEAGSALPDAPVVPEHGPASRRRRRASVVADGGTAWTVRVRMSVARGLERAAAAVEPRLGAEAGTDCDRCAEAA